MSTAAATPTSYITHLPRTAHPIPLREHAFALHCQGLRSPAIAAELGVPERTIRSWINAALDDLKDDLQLSRKEHLLLAVERQHQLTATAWQQFEREAAARDALLDATLQALLNANDSGESASASTRSLHLHLPASTPAPRYLSLILQANKETNRLLGLHTLAKLQLLQGDSPTIPEPDLRPPTNCHTPAETATATPESQTAAKTATTPSPLTADPVETPCWIPAADDFEIPAETATAAPAETATASHTPCFSVSSVLNRRPLAAKTATAPTAPIAPGLSSSACAHLGGI